MTVLWIVLRLIAVFAVMVAALHLSMSLVGMRVRSPLSVAIAIGLFCTLFVLIPWVGWLLAGLFAFRCISKLTGAPLMPVYVPSRKRVFRRNVVIFGEPYHPQRTPERASQEDYESIAEDLMARIRALEPKET